MRWSSASARPFLEHGPRALKPLSRSAVAEELGIHLSTVSRAASGKHAQTPWGIFALSTFFPAPAKGTRDEPRDSARDAVRAIVAEEDRARPLSDDEICERLRALGFRIARRTVAKYRSELGIESSYRRRL
jgi:RNA polymerase sigma-54 factor